MVELRACCTCGAVQAYPRPVCPACKGRGFAPAPLPLRGEVYSLTTVHRAPSPSFAELVPYTLALVRAGAGGLVLVTAQRPVAIGDPVTIDRDGDHLVIPAES